MGECIRPDALYRGQKCVELSSTLPPPVVSRHQNNFLVLSHYINVKQFKISKSDCAYTLLRKGSDHVSLRQLLTLKINLIKST
jgi:hypothetical protein